MRSFLRILCGVLVLCCAVSSVPVVAAENGSDNATVPDTVTVVIASCDIPMGTRVREKHLITVDVKNVNLPENIISDPAEVVGQCLGERMGEGEYFRDEALFKKQIAPVHEELLLGDPVPSKNKYVAVTDYVMPDTGKDVAGILQKIIDNNHERTLYFPDGEYLISQSLLTSGFDGERVSFLLSDGAVIRATEDWQSVDGNNALICMGSQRRSNSGHNMIVGGVLDCAGKADGISIDSCLDSYVHNVCILDPKTGIDVKLGIHNKSSCWDITNVTIIGSGAAGSVGMNVDGFDNTITDIRIYDMQLGIKAVGAGNFFKNICVTNSVVDDGYYKINLGIDDRANNWYNNCYVENCATAYSMHPSSLFWDNGAKWMGSQCKTQIALKLTGGMIPVIGFRAEFFGESTLKTMVETSSDSDATEMLFGCMSNINGITGSEVLS